jgi:diguanylate cyclase (GGDEF)-like protein
VDTALRRLAAENQKLKRRIGALENALRGALDKAHDLEALAYRDCLTGLPNRRSLADRLHALLSADTRGELAVLFLDLDDFSRVNEALGHRIADELLRELAGTLDGLLRSVAPPVPFDGAAVLQPHGVLSRLGGDEFVILLPQIRDRAAAASVAARILERLERPFHVASRAIVVTASIGIALYPSDGHTVDSLVSHADAAMYAAKRRGKACYEHYRSAVDGATLLSCP